MPPNVVPPRTTGPWKFRWAPDRRNEREALGLEYNKRLGLSEFERRCFTEAGLRLLQAIRGAGPREM